MTEAVGLPPEGPKVVELIQGNDAEADLVMFATLLADEVITGIETVPVRDTWVELNVGQGGETGPTTEESVFEVPAVADDGGLAVPVTHTDDVELETGHGGIVAEAPAGIEVLLEVTGPPEWLVDVQVALALAVNVEFGNWGMDEIVAVMLVAFHTDVMTTVPAVESPGEPFVGVMVMLEFQGAVRRVPLEEIGIGVPDTRLLEPPVDSLREVVLDAGYGAIALELLAAEGNAPVPDGKDDGLASLTEPRVPLGNTVELAGNQGATVTAILVRMTDPVPEMTSVDVGRITVITGGEVQFPVGLDELYELDDPGLEVPAVGRTSDPVPNTVEIKTVPSLDIIMVEFGSGNGTRVCEADLVDGGMPDAFQDVADGLVDDLKPELDTTLTRLLTALREVVDLVGNGVGLLELLRVVAVALLFQVDEIGT
ncbi:hypothetical protein CORC01_08874 [Colletotrichum orchidophilum]|uniref:Uncharacterized protein n=1 Tax=Colletotrichum orchidophilum TaxID=1209926 RepID=A0A1G4B3A5_9PEZI|nr:uncharacterized protein CORC01_08874 [Colletotrichum orchidophilum]OHE95877.1 hypothetical protein CORC01_08874 [Colletotrichum orchidophilum]